MRLLIYIIAFSSFSLFAGTPDSLKTKKWAVGITCSPDYCYRVSYIKDGEVPTTNTTEKGKFGFTSGVNLLYRLMDKIGIEFGVLYSTKGQKTSTPPVSWQTAGSSTSPSTYVTMPERLTSYTYKYLEIPLKVNVYVINKRLKVFPSIGCSANIFTGKTTKTKYILADSSPIKTTQNFQRKNIPSTEFALLLGVGLSYDINKNIFVKLEPSYRTFIRPLVDGPVSGTLYSIGANAGVYFNF
jgi:opacity protein-like surface antigen